MNCPVCSFPPIDVPPGFKVVERGHDAAIEAFVGCENGHRFFVTAILTAEIPEQHFEVSNA